MLSRILTVKLPLDMLAELTHELQAVEMKISKWKAHQLGSIQQEEAKQHILQNLCQSLVLIFMDWAMQFLPRAYLKTQADWYGKHGICWHVRVLVTQADDPSSPAFLGQHQASTI